MCLPACECASFWAVKLFELLLDDVQSIVSMRIKILNVIFQSCGKRLIRPDAQDVNKMLNFETDDETDADSIFSRQTSRDDCLDAFDDEDEGGGFGGVGRNGGGANRGVARGMLDRRTFSRVKFSKDHDIHTFSCGELADGRLFVSPGWIRFAPQKRDHFPMPAPLRPVQRSLSAPIHRCGIRPALQ